MLPQVLGDRASNKTYPGSCLLAVVPSQLPCCLPGRVPAPPQKSAFTSPPSCQSATSAVPAAVGDIELQKSDPEIQPGLLRLEISDGVPWLTGRTI